MRQRRRLRQALGSRPGRRLRLLVLCFGNICRSPFAAELLRARLAEVRPDIEVASAGFLAVEGRRSPDTAVARAAELGVDLSSHRSRYARDAEVAEADAVLIFDGANLGEYDRRGLPGRDRVVAFGAFCDPPGEIEDPYGGDDATFRATYQRIAHAVDAIVAALRPAR